MPMIPTAVPQQTCCPSRTSLRWTPDGELASEDQHDILARLAAVDPYGQRLRSCELAAAGPPLTPTLR